jgi:PAS domain S-box-containing protein
MTDRKTRNKTAPVPVPRRSSRPGKETGGPFRGRWIQEATKEEVISVLDSVPCGLFVVGSRLGESLYINPEVLKISGYDLADIPTARVARKMLFTDNKTRRQQARFHEEMIQGITQNPFLSRIVRKDGTVIICEVRCVELENGFIVGVWTDVTRREVAEEELRLKEARLRSLFQESFDAVLLLEGDRIVDCNQAAEEVLRVPSRDELLRMNFEELFPKDGPETLPVSIKTKRWVLTATRKKKARFEGILRRFDGEIFPAEVTIISLRLHGKKVLHVLLRDITSLKEAEMGLIAAKEGLEDRVKERTAELTRVNRELKRSREELRRLSEHLQRAREEERTRVARDVHDELGQLLTALKMDVAYCQEHMDEDRDALCDNMKAMETQIHGGIATVRRICADLRPHVLERLGLSAGIEWFVNGFQRRTGIRCTVSISPGIPDPGSDLSLVLFRVLQEAMTNVARHSGATEVSIKLSRKTDVLLLRVKDNGKGITREEVENPESYGIIGIRERIRFWGGRSAFTCGKRGGTSVTVWLPISKRGAQRGDE